MAADIMWQIYRERRSEVVMIVSSEEESHKPAKVKRCRPGERNSGRNALSLPLIRHWLLSQIMHLPLAKPRERELQMQMVVKKKTPQQHHLN